MTNKRQLAYIGVDFWNRPVFKDSFGNIFGNMDILFNENKTFEEVNKKITEDSIYYFGRNIDDDPQGIKINPNKITLVKKLETKED